MEKSAKLWYLVEANGTEEWGVSFHGNQLESVGGSAGGKCENVAQYYIPALYCVRISCTPSDTHLSHIYAHAHPYGQMEHNRIYPL